MSLFFNILAALGHTTTGGGGTGGTGGTGGGTGGGPLTGPPIGTIYSKTTWADLTDFTIVSTPWSIVGGHLISPSVGDHGVSNYLQLLNPTALDQYTAKIKWKNIDTALSDRAIGIGLRSINPNSAPGSEVFFMESDATNGLKAVGLQLGGNGFYYGSAVMPAYSIGDQMQTTFDVNRGTAVVTIDNLTKGTTVSVTVINDFSNTAAGSLLSNTGKWTLFPQYSKYEISEITITSSAVYQPAMMGVGDSITQGSIAGSPSNRWAELLGAEVYGGAGDKTAEVLARIPEITGIIKPAKVYLMIGTNDIGFAIPTATWQANYQSIVSQLQAAGIAVRVCAPLPRNDHDLSGFKSWLQTTYPSLFIDTYTPLLGSGTSLNATYNSGDGIHPNAAGHLKIKDTIVASGL